MAPVRVSGSVTREIFYRAEGEKTGRNIAFFTEQVLVRDDYSYRQETHSRTT